MITEEERKFIKYWEENRLKKKKFLRQLSVGLPSGVLLVLLIFINLMSGWNQKAEMAIRATPSLIIVLLVAFLAIVVFYAIFSVKHSWDQNEQYYQELISRHNSGQ